MSIDNQNGTSLTDVSPRPEDDENKNNESDPKEDVLVSVNNGEENILDVRKQNEDVSDSANQDDKQNINIEKQDGYEGTGFEKENVIEKLDEKLEAVDYKDKPGPGFVSPKIINKELERIHTPKSSKKCTPKSRFQPVRKSSTKNIDYCETRKRKRRSSTDIPSKRIKTDLSISPTTLEKSSNIGKNNTTISSRYSKKPNEKIMRISSKNMELSKIRKLRKQTKQHRLHNERNMKLALQGTGYAPLRSINVTKPKEFNLTMSNRFKDHQMNTRSNSGKTFERNLRQRPSSPEYKNENTKPVPFNFKLPEKMVGPTLNWESFAQSTMKFQTRTPTRFRVKPSEEDKSFLEKKPTKKLLVTMPITPKLLTRGRSRRYKVDAAKELEEKEIEKIRSYQFKATEFNPKIVEMKGMYGVKHVPVSTSTEVKPFSFESDYRFANRTSKDATLLQEINEENCEKKAKSSSRKLKPTQPKAFSFENKDKVRYSRKEEKIKEQILLEKKMHEFQASLLPSFSPDVLPSVTTKKPTRMKPFNISEGSVSYLAKLDETSKTEAVEEQSKRIFKAQSADVVKKRPFQPITGLIPPTNIANITLNTDIRSEERDMIASLKDEKNKILEEERREFEKQEQLKEEEEIRKLRKQIVHKANPVRNFKPLTIHKSEVPLTTPETPNLEVKKRAMSRL